MAEVHLKSTPITNLDAEPRVQNTAGEGGAGALKLVDAFLTPTASDSAASTYQMVRLPSNALVKRVWFASGAQGGSAAVDIGVYYASDEEDVQDVNNMGDVIDADFFASAVVISSAVGTAGALVDVTHESGVFELTETHQPLWQALDLTSDPGGKFDIVITVTVALSSSVTPVYLAVEYIAYV